MLDREALRQPERVEQYRRSVSMLPPQAWAMRREEAVEVLAALVEALLGARAQK